MALSAPNSDKLLFPCLHWWQHLKHNYATLFLERRKSITADGHQSPLRVTAWMDDVQKCTIMCLSLQFVSIPFPLRESYILGLLPQYFEIILLTWYVWHAEMVILLIWVTPVGWGNAANGFPTRWGGSGCSSCRSGEPDTVRLITGVCSSFQTSVLQEALHFPILH